MYRLSGLKNICSTDASPTVVAKMRERARASGCGAITWAVADMLALPYDAASFDVVIEKGSIDCFMVDNKDPWNPLPEVRARVATVLSEAHRVLTPHGCLLSITFAAPHFRKPLFNVRRAHAHSYAPRGACWAARRWWH
jgi:ubiquinone/menaquinone biosynthesis C-methylase UbiE